MTSPPFRRIVITGVESSGKSTLARALAEELAWPYIPEAARSHPHVLNNTVSRPTFDALHQRQTDAVRDAIRAGHPGSVCDTGDLVLQIWAEKLGIHWAPDPSDTLPVQLYVLCPSLRVWEPDPLRSLPSYDDRIALEASYRERLNPLPHVIVRGERLEQRLHHLLSILRS